MNTFGPKLKCNLYFVICIEMLRPIMEKLIKLRLMCAVDSYLGDQVPTLAICCMSLHLFTRCQAIGVL